jgi:hypothetical protein
MSPATPSQRIVRVGIVGGLVGGLIYLLTGKRHTRSPSPDLPVEPVAIEPPLPGRIRGQYR